MSKKVIALLAVVMMLLGITAAHAGSEPTNILLLGTDDLGEMVTGEEEMSRADAIYVLNLHPDTGAVKLLSIERDYLVTLPDGNGENKLATATFFGGPELALRMVNEMFKLNIPYYAQVDIPKIVEAVDVIGGLDVRIEAEEVAPVNAFIDSLLDETIPYVTEGMNHLTGNQLWAFIGTRDISIDAIESNRQRNERQQRAVRAGLQKLHEMTLDEALDAVDKVLPFINTNITISEILSMTETLMNSDAEQFTYLRSPVTDAKKKRAGLHQVIVAADMEAEIRAVHEYLAK